MRRWVYLALLVWTVILVRYAVIQTRAARETFVWDMQESGGWQISRSGEYGDVLSYSAAKRLLLQMAQRFGVNSEGEFTLISKDNGSVTRYEKQGSSWELVMEYTVIRGESMWDSARSYLNITLCMQPEGEALIESSEAYRAILDGWCAEQEINGQTSTFYTFRRKGRLSEAEQQAWCRQVLQSCEGEEISADFSGNTYLLYGYSAHFDRYMKLDGKKVNLNLAVFVQEQEDCTVMQVGIPYIPF